MKSYTNLEQSNRLAEFLPLESADMFLALNGTLPVMSKYIDNGLVTADDTAIPCWSLAALFDVLPKFIGDYGKCLYYDVGGYYCGYKDDGNFMLTIQETKADNPVDACVNMILKLKEKNLL